MHESQSGPHMTTLRTILVLGAATLMAAGCTKPLEVGSITEITSTTGSKGIDVHELKRAKGQPGVPEFAGDQLFEVRTFANEDGQGEKEIDGAACTVSAADFSAKLTTPAKVRVPLYRAQSSTLAVACEKAGYKKRSITVTAIDITRHGRYASGSSGGVIGLVAAVAVDGLSDNTKNDWKYPYARVVLEKPEKP
jgi:hypothetical protein